MAVSLINPFEAASIHYSRETASSGYPNTIEALKLHLASAPASTHQDAYVLWASVHRALGEFDAMEAKLEQAQVVGAQFWRCQTEGQLSTRYYNFVGSLRREHGKFEEAEVLFKLALRADRKNLGMMRKLLALRAGWKNLGAMSNLGLLYWDRWWLDEARRWFWRIVRDRPNSSRGYRGLGLVAMRSMKLDEALQFFDRAIDVAPLTRWPRINRLEAMRRKGDFSAALTAIEDFKRIDPSFPPLFRAWGDILRDMGELDLSLEKFREAIALAPFDPWGYVGQADVLRRLLRTEEAIASAEKALELRPELPGAILMLANSLRDRGDFRGTLQWLRRLHRIAPHEPFAYASLAHELRRQSHFDEARAMLASMPIYCQQAPDNLNALGRLNFDQGDLHAAMANFKDAIKAAPYEPWGYLGQSDVLRDQGQYADAIAMAESALRVRPNLPAALRTWGEALRAQGDLVGAAAKFQQAIKAAPYEPWGYLGQSDVLRRQGQYTDAIAMAESALRVRPNLPAALRTWGEALRAQGDLVGAAAKFQQAIKAAPYEPWGYLGQSNVLRDQGQYADAIAMAESALRRRPNLPAALRTWGYALREQGDLVGAAAKFQQAVDAGDPWASLALEEILPQLDQAVNTLPVPARILAAFRSSWRMLFRRRGIASEEVLPSGLRSSRAFYVQGLAAASRDRRHRALVPLSCPPFIPSFAARAIYTAETLMGNRLHWPMLFVHSSPGCPANWTA